MRYIFHFFIFVVLLGNSALANWKKISDTDYIWGPFKIYNISLFSEKGKYTENLRPIMLSFKYEKPVDGRDFAIGLAKSWRHLGLKLTDQEEVVDRLRKILPNIKKGDTLYYIALSDKGYFILNDQIIDFEFNSDFNNAIVSVWLDPKVEIGKSLLNKQSDGSHNVTVESDKKDIDIASIPLNGEVVLDEDLHLPNTQLDSSSESPKDNQKSNASKESSEPNYANLDDQEQQLKDKETTTKPTEDNSNPPVENNDIEVEISEPMDLIFLDYIV